MKVLSGRQNLTIAAVLEIAMHKHNVEKQELRNTALPNAATIAARINAPPRYLEKTFQHLVKDKVLEGVRGPRGGYRLARPTEEISLLKIAEVVDAMASEVEDLSRQSPAVVKFVDPFVRKAATAFEHELSKITIADLLAPGPQQAEARSERRASIRGVVRVRAKKRQSIIKRYR
jgi:Rrf2 family protein